jgi:hypothetical protein
MNREPLSGLLTVPQPEWRCRKKQERFLASPACGRQARNEGGGVAESIDAVDAEAD